MLLNFYDSHRAFTQGTGRKWTRLGHVLRWRPLSAHIVVNKAISDCRWRIYRILESRRWVWDNFSVMIFKHYWQCSSTWTFLYRLINEFLNEQMKLILKISKIISNLPSNNLKIIFICKIKIRQSTFFFEEEMDKKKKKPEITL